MLVLDGFMDVKGWKVLGNRLSQDKVKKVVLKSDKVGEAPVVARKLTPAPQAFESEGDTDEMDANDIDENGPETGGDSGNSSIETKVVEKGPDKPSNDGNVILGGDGSPQLNLL